MQSHRLGFPRAVYLFSCAVDVPFSIVTQTHIRIRYLRNYSYLTSILLIIIQTFVKPNFNGELSSNFIVKLSMIIYFKLPMSDWFFEEFILQQTDDIFVSCSSIWVKLFSQINIHSMNATFP